MPPYFEHAPSSVTSFYALYVDDIIYVMWEHVKSLVQIIAGFMHNLSLHLLIGTINFYL